MGKITKPRYGKSTKYFRNSPYFGLYDYENMRLHMIYGKSVSFEELMSNLNGLNERINKMLWNL